MKSYGYFINLIHVFSNLFSFSSCLNYIIFTCTWNTYSMKVFIHTYQKRIYIFFSFFIHVFELNEIITCNNILFLFIFEEGKRWVLVVVRLGELMKRGLRDHWMGVVWPLWKWDKTTNDWCITITLASWGIESYEGPSAFYKNSFKLNMLFLKKSNRMIMRLFAGPCFLASY